MPDARRLPRQSLMDSAEVITEMSRRCLKAYALFRTDWASDGRTELAALIAMGSDSYRAKSEQSLSISLL